MRFNGIVAVTNTPQFVFELGDESRTAGYRSDLSTCNTFPPCELVFTYTVQRGDFDADGISWQANPIDLNGGTIRFRRDAQIVAVLDIPAQGRHPNTASTSARCSIRQW